MRAKKPTLLVVDDEQDQCQSINNYFAKRNFLVFTAASGKEALSLIKEHKPDLVLLDLKLPGGINGIDVLRILREYDKNTKVAVLTGDLLAEQEIQKISDLGIVKFLIKPVDFKTLEDIVKKALKVSYPQKVHLEVVKPKSDAMRASLISISHDLTNIAHVISGKCELYILDTEDGLYKDKTEKERLEEAVKILKYVLKSTGRLTELAEKTASLTKKRI